MCREWFDVALCTVELLKRQSEIEGVLRGKKEQNNVPD